MLRKRMGGKHFYFALYCRKQFRLLLTYTYVDWQFLKHLEKRIVSASFHEKTIL